jgi:hypothetical protein
MQNSDLLVSILDKSCLSIADVQANVFRQINCSCQIANCSRIGMLLKDAHAMKLSLQRERLEVVSGTTLEDCPRGFPTCDI